MLNQLRQSVSSWTVKILLGLLVVSFAVWGVAGVATGVGTTVLTAGETEVSVEDYRIAYEQALARVSQQIGRRPSAEEAEVLGIDQSILSQLTASAVLDEQGRAIGLGLSESGLLRLISENPAFQDANGNFSRDAFRAILSNAGISEAAYIGDLGETALRAQIVQAISDGARTPAAYANALGLYNGERRTVDVVTVEPEAAETIADPSEEVLAAYFSENAETYRAPEYRAFSYATLDPAAVADPSAVSEEEIAAEYERVRSSFTTPERRRVQQIVFSDVEAAEAAAARLQGGATFEEIATESGRSVEDTDLGLLARADVPDAAIAEAAFALPANGTSAVVEGAFGPAILRVTEIQPEAVRPLDEVREELRQALAVDTATDAVTTAYDAFEDARGSGATITEAAQRAGLTVQTVPAIDAEGNAPDGEPVANLPAGGDLLEEVFQAEENADNAPINYDSNSFVFYDVTSIEPARDRTLDEVRARVLADWKAGEAERRLAERMTALKARVESGESLADVAASEGLTVSTASGITRESGPAELGAAATTAAFSGPSGLVATAGSREAGRQVLLQVSEVSLPADPLSNVPPAQSEQTAAALRNDLLQSYVTLLQDRYPVSYNSSTVDAARGTVR